MLVWKFIFDENSPLPNIDPSLLQNYPETYFLYSCLSKYNLKDIAWTPSLAISVSRFLNPEFELEKELRIRIEFCLNEKNRR